MDPTNEKTKTAEEPIATRATKAKLQPDPTTTPMTGATNEKTNMALAQNPILERFEIEGIPLTIEALNVPNVEEMRKIIDMIGKNGINPEELSSPEAMTAYLENANRALKALAEKNEAEFEELGGLGNPAVFFVVRDQNGEVVGLSTGVFAIPESHNPFKGLGERELNSATYLAAYMVIKESINDPQGQKVDLRQQGLATRILMNGRNYVEKLGIKFGAATLEGVDDRVEGLANNNGARRVYTKEGEQYKEISFYMAPLIFNADGDPIVESPSEHLLVTIMDKIGERTITKKELIDLITDITKGLHYLNKEEFIKLQREEYIKTHGNTEGFKPDTERAEKALQKQIGHLQKYMDDVVKRFKEIDTFYLFTQAERKKEPEKFIPNTLYKEGIRGQ